MLPPESLNGQILPFGQSSPGGSDHPLQLVRRIGVFEAETDFKRQTGRTDKEQALCSWREHTAGYLLSELQFETKRGLELPSGIFRWTFRIQRGDEPVQLNGSTVFRLSVWDVSTGERLIERSISSGEFAAAGDTLPRAPVHSTTGRAGHRFEPRVYWEGEVDGSIDSVTLEQVTGYPEQSLEKQSLAAEDLVQRSFLDPIPGTDARGLVVSRPRSPFSNATSMDQGNSALSTGYYVAAEAFRRMARPEDTEALANMENGFRALHFLHAVTKQSGIVARYADTNGNWRVFDPLELRWKSGRLVVPFPPAKPFIEEWARTVTSEDVVTAFALAVGAGYPQIADPQLK